MNIFKKLYIIVTLFLVSTIYASNTHPTFHEAAKHVKVAQDDAHYNDLWQQVAHDFSLPHYENAPEVKKEIKWFQKHPQYMEKIGKYGQYYMYYIYQEGKRRNLPTELVLLPMIESAYDPFAYSWVGAAGIWQMMPQTGSSFGLKQDWWYDGRKAIEPETRAALDYLTYLDSFFNGNWLLAIASYDAGEGTLQSAVNRNARRGISTSFWDLRLPKETEDYVPKLLGLAAIVKNPKKYGVDLPYIANKPYFAAVTLDKQIELSRAAKMAGISLDDLYELNPGYTRWATDPDGPYQLLLPVDTVNTFEENLAKQEGITALVWRHHIVQRHDTLESLSKKYHTTPDAISKVNHLKSSHLRNGSAILIPSNVEDAKAPKDQTPNPKQKKGSHHGMQQYRVKPGDNLWTIAHQHHMSLNTLLALNHLNRDTKIKPGELLNISLPHSTYRIKKGDSLSKVAHELGVSITQLEVDNHLSAKSKIYPGESLTY